MMPKTVPTKQDPFEFIAKSVDEKQVSSCHQIIEMMEEVTGHKPVMWGTSIIGFDKYHTKTGEWPALGFSPRKGKIALYTIADNVSEKELEDLGKNTHTKSCLYIKSIDDVDSKKLKAVFKKAYERTTEAND
ncbi:MAG: DUF1801 domain-containing protein [Micrococcaceae bacterium]